MDPVSIVGDNAGMGTTVWLGYEENCLRWDDRILLLVVGFQEGKDDRTVPPRPWLLLPAINDRDTTAVVNRTGNIVLHGVNEVDNRDDRVNLFIALCIIDQVHFQIDAVVCDE